MVLHQRVWESNPHTCRIELRLTSTGPTLPPGVHGVLERHVGIEPALAPPTELPSSGLCTFTTMPHKAGLSRLPPIISLCSASWLLASGSIGNLSSCPRSQMRRVRAWWELPGLNRRPTAYRSSKVARTPCVYSRPGFAIALPSELNPHIVPVCSRLPSCFVSFAGL